MPLKPYAPSMLGEEFSATLNGKTITIPEYGVVDEPAETLMAYGGEINEFSDLASVDLPGVLRQQYDGTAVLDLRDYKDGMTIFGTKSDGTRVSIDIARCLSKHGWPEGRAYILARDANENIVPERGDDSRDIYVSTDPAALTSAAIGAAQSPALTAAQITGAWLVARPQYGGSAAQKVSIEVANKIKTQRGAMRTAFNALGTSDWYYLEAGKDPYTGLNFSQTGESPLHPIVVTRFGTGHDPSGHTFGGNGAGQPGNIVFIGASPYMRSARGFENILVADGYGDGYYGTDATSRATGLTFYRMSGLDNVLPFPINKDNIPQETWWDENANRWSGAYWAWVNASYVESCFYDHNGWADSYDRVLNENGELVATRLWNNGEFGQPPSGFSHNIYTQKYNGDMTFKEVLSMRAASVAAQQRVGGWQLRCISIDNPIAFQNAGVHPTDIEPSKADENGFFPFNLRSVAHLGSDRPYGYIKYALMRGFDWQGARSTDIDCIALYAADPDDPAEVARKTSIQQPATWSRGSRYSNFMAFGWRGKVGSTWDKDINTVGMINQELDKRTVLRWAGKKLNKPNNGRATLWEFSNYLRAMTPRQRQLAIRELNQYFVEVRGTNIDLPVAPRTTPGTNIFKPSWKGEGRRSDNPANWSLLTTPIDGDSLDLFGNRMDWVTETKALNHLKARPGGLCHVSSGKLTFATADVGDSVATSFVGQLHINTFNGQAAITGGRFSMKNSCAGSIGISGWGQCSLGTTHTVRSGEVIRLNGDLFKFGWDAIAAAGNLIFEAGSTLEIHATPVIEYAPWHLNTWDFWLNDFIGQTSGATGKFDGVRRMGDRAYARIRNLVGTPVVGEKTTKGEWLAPANGQIFNVHHAVIGQITAGWRGRSGIATGASHGIQFKTGSNIILTGGKPLAGAKDITGPGITVTAQTGVNFGAGFSVTGGKLVLTI